MMNSYYEPTLLFRQNAMKRRERSGSDASAGSGDSSSSSVYSGETTGVRTGLRSPWMMRSGDPRDTEVLNKACSLNRVNIHSSYWKIPDTKMNITSIDVEHGQDDEPRLAVASANSDSNLFIYKTNLTKNYLTHQNTITLPNIHSMKWIPQLHNAALKLVAGADQGYAYMVSIPNFDDEDQSAEVIKRFNHKKHIRDSASGRQLAKAGIISEIKVFETKPHIMSLYGDRLFTWDYKDSEALAKPQPLSIAPISGISTFDPRSEASSTLAVGGKFGVSLFDTRSPKFNVPPSMMSEARRKGMRCNAIKWCPNSDYVFAAAHLDGIVRLWDVRKQDHFGKLDGHQNRRVNSLEWGDGSDIFTGGHDGNVVHWDLPSLSSCGADAVANCTLREGIDSVHFDPKTNSVTDIASQRQCGTVLPASNSNIISMCTVKDSEDEVKVFSVDSSAFFGIHSKIHAAASDKLDLQEEYYSKESLDLLASTYTPKTDSNSTLVDGTPPLDTKARLVDVPSSPASADESLSEDTVMSSPYSLMSDHSLLSPDSLNGSVETLQQSPVASKSHFHDTHDPEYAADSFADEKPLNRMASQKAMSHRSMPSASFASLGLPLPFFDDFLSSSFAASSDLKSSSADLNRAISFKTSATNYYSIYSS